jgi:putative aldouronate transport system substrate-binding protein
MAVGRNSKNPERALMAFDLLAQDEDMYQTHYYGVEGVTYVKTDKGLFKAPDGKKPEELYTFGGLGFDMGLRNNRFIKDDPSSNCELFVKYNMDPDVDAKYGLHSPLAPLNYDTDSIKSELAALDNIYSTMGVLFICGLSNDLAGDLQKYKEKSTAAGIDKVLTELNKQSAAFLKGK